MTVKIKVGKQTPLPVHKFNDFGQGHDCRRPVVGVFVMSVEIEAVGIESCVAISNAVRIQHGDNQENAVIENPKKMKKFQKMGKN